MNQNAPMIELIEEIDSQPAEQVDNSIRYIDIGESVSKLRYLVGSVRPAPEKGELADFVPAVAEAPLQKRFVEPVVWTVPAVETEAFLALQRWEGVVTECREQTFLARLTDLTSGGPNEEVELLLDDISREDLPLVELGAVFYWAIGYRNEASGQRYRVSTLRFRRLPVWSESELKAAKKRAEGIAEVFGGD